MNPESTEVTFCVRGVVSPLLANLFLHYVFDRWMRRTSRASHSSGTRTMPSSTAGVSERREMVLEAIRGRFEQCGLELHPAKTRIVYCKDDDRPGDYEHVAFDFLGYTFQPRRARNRRGKHFRGLPSRDQRQGRQGDTDDHPRVAVGLHQEEQRLEDLAANRQSVVRGWMNYYGRYYRSKCVQVLRHLNEALAAWVRRKYTTGFAAGSVRRCTGWAASRDRDPGSLSCGSSV